MSTRRIIGQSLFTFVFCLVAYAINSISAWTGAFVLGMVLGVSLGLAFRDAQADARARRLAEQPQRTNEAEEPERINETGPR